jgi:predicted nuclease of predicted toxin-antitoxin system
VRWLADECVGAPLVTSLRSLGHDVLHVAEIAAGLSDLDVIGLAAREKRILLTEDKDFGELVFRRKHPVPGLVLLRIVSEYAALKTVRLAAAIDHHGEKLFQRYLVIEKGRFRSVISGIARSVRSEGKPEVGRITVCEICGQSSEHGIAHV